MTSRRGGFNKKSRSSLDTNKLSNNQALISLLKCCIGTGILAMPRAFYLAGWVVGFIGCFVVGTIIVYSLHMLIGGMQILKVKYNLIQIGYRNTMAQAILLGPPGIHYLSRAAGILVDIFLVIYHFGVMCVYVVFIAFNITDQLNVYYYVETRLVMVCLLVPLLPPFLFRRLKELFIFHVIGTALLLISIVCIFYYVFSFLPPLSHCIAFNNVKGYPLFYGTLLFAIEAVGVLVLISEDMKHPEDFLGTFGILNKGMFAVITLYAIVGFFGYWHFGDEIEGSITLNLPPIWISNAIQMMCIISIYCSYPLQGLVAVDIIWNNCIIIYNENIHDSYEYILRSILVCLSVLVAVMLPDIASIISFFGAFCLSFLGIIFPAIINLCLLYGGDRYGPNKIHIWKNIFIILFGLVGGAFGTISSIFDIYKKIYIN